MARLYIPEPKIDLYKHGFEPHIDKLGRKETGDKLSDLVERIDDPLVIALDGAWGSGKSVFLKCWVGEHLKLDGNTTQTVYFDAFKHDYMDDPLIALTGEILNRKDHPTKPLSERALAKLKETAPHVKRGLLRGGIALATAGVVQHGDELVDGVAKAAGKDLAKATDKFWAEESGRRQAMKSFRDALTDLTEPVTADQQRENEELNEGDPTRKLIVVIDELDRCRPDYALSLLEIIKHFFAVDGVHFVLGVNLEELKNSVRTRYGSGIDGAKYIQKFVTAILPISGRKVGLGEMGTYSKHFEDVSKATGFDRDHRFRWFRDYLIMIDHHKLVSLRDIERLVSQALLTPPPTEKYKAELHLYTGLSILRIIDPETMVSARRNQLEFDYVQRLFKLDHRGDNQGVFSDAKHIWPICTIKPDGRFHSILTDSARAAFFKKSTERQDSQTMLADIVAKYFDTFSIPGLE